MRRWMLILFAVIFSVVAWSKTASSPVKYYYTVGQEVPAEEWAYPVPECAKLEGPKYAGLKKSKRCEPFGVDAAMCQSDDTGVFTSIVGEKKARFKLNYLVFNTADQCRADREEFLQGGE